MASNYRKLGEFIEQTNERNDTLRVTKLLGVSIEKKFMPSIANTIGTDFSSYKVVHPGEFAYGPVTSRNGDKISIAYYEDVDDCIISSSYTPFAIVEDGLQAEYLMMWFNRSEFDRYARFKSHGSAREVFDWDQLCAVELPVPDIETQCKIVGIKKCIEARMNSLAEQNDYLEELIGAMFNEFYMAKWGEDLPCGWSFHRVEDIAEKVAMGPFGSNIKVETFVEEGVSIISGAHLRGLLLEEVEYNHITEEHAERLHNSIVYPGDIVFTHAGNIGQAALITEWSNEPKYIISQRQFYLRCDKSKMLPEIPALYFHTRIGKHVLTANSTSTGVPSIAQPSSYLKSIELLVPDMESQKRFVKKIKPLLHLIVLNRKECKGLEQLRDTLLPKLMSGEIDVSKVDITQLNNHLA